MIIIAWIGGKVQQGRALAPNTLSHPFLARGSRAFYHERRLEIRALQRYRAGVKIANKLARVDSVETTKALETLLRDLPHILVDFMAC